MRTSVVLTLLVLVCSGLSQPVRSDTSTLARAGEWELLLVEDPFGDPQRICTARSRSLRPIDDPRTRPRLRLIAGTSQLFIDPTVELTKAMRSGPSHELHHQLRVDDGEIFQASINTPDLAPWAVHKSIERTPQLVKEMRDGRSLFYQWKLGEASETFTIRLDGLGTVLKQASGKCP